MASGWDKSSGALHRFYVSESDFWASFNYVFSEACAKRTTYKFGLIKSILDCLLDVSESDRGLELAYQKLFSKFAENYWNLVTKYHLKQMIPSSQSSISKIEQIFADVTVRLGVPGFIEFDSLSAKDKDYIIDSVSKECRKNVVGALYENFDGQLYGFSLKENGIWLNPVAYEFMLKYKPEIEQLNYYAWAKFLERTNAGTVLAGVLGKLELSTPRRSDLSYYRQILQHEFSDNTCFYCGKKLKGVAHVDHVIPWSFVKTDNLWNFVLACPKCNIKKKDHLPTRDYLAKVICRNDILLTANNQQILAEFDGYRADILWRIWDYAKISGIHEMSV